MTNEIVYCDACGNMISPGDIAKGEFFSRGQSSICKTCLATLPPEKRAPARSGPRKTPTPRPSSRRTPTPVPHSDSHATANSGRALILAGGGLGVLVGAIVALAVVGGSRGSPSATPQNGITFPVPVVPHVVSPIVTSDSQQGPDEPDGTDGSNEPKPSGELDSIRAMIEPSLGRYDEIRSRLLAFAEADSPDAPEAKALLADIDSRFAAIADEAWLTASRAARELSSKGQYADAVSMLRSIESRFRATPWLAKRSSDIESAIEEVLREKGAVADGILAEASAALNEGEFERVGVLLASQDGWTDEQREAASGLIGSAEKQREAAEEARRRKRAMQDFARAFVEAGAKGLFEATALLERERGAMAENGHGRTLDRLAEYARQGKSVESLAADTFSNTRGIIRLQVAGERVSGRIASVEAGVIKIKPAVGTPVEVMLSALDPKDIIDASGLMEAGAEGGARIAAYYLARGQLEAAWVAVREITERNAETLAEDIDLMKEALDEDSAAKKTDEEIDGAAESAVDPAPPEDLQVDQSFGMPGIWAELENVEGAATKDSPIASSGKYVAYYGNGRVLRVVLRAERAMPAAVVYIRYSRGFVDQGSVDIYTAAGEANGHEDAGVKLQGRLPLDASGNWWTFVWVSRTVVDIPEGQFTLFIRCPTDKGAGDMDLVGIVPSEVAEVWTPPREIEGGVFLEGGKRLSFSRPALEDRKVTAKLMARISQVFPSELFPNGAFEDDSADAPRPWKTLGAGNGIESLDGNRVLKVSSRQIFEWNAAKPIASDEEYVLTCRVKHDGVSTGQRLCLWAQLPDRHEPPGGPKFSDWWKGTSDWQDSEIRFRMPKGITRFTIFFDALDSDYSGTCWYDDFSLRLAGGGRTNDLDMSGIDLSPGILVRLAKRHDSAKVKPRTVATIGDALAGSRSFSRALKLALNTRDGYVFSSMTNARLTVEAAAAKSEGFISQYAPEVTRICFSPRQLLRGGTLEEMESKLSLLVDGLLESGSVPVLYTFPTIRQPDVKAQEIVNAYNAAMLKLASAKGIPAVDAFGLLNADAKKLKDYFRSDGGLKDAAHDAVNDAFLVAYRMLELLVMNRPVPAGALPIQAEEEPQRTGGARPAAAPLPRSAAKNLVVNGGFESIDAATRFASNWTAHDSGTGGRSTMRVDSSNPHSHERSLLVRGLEGNLPGAFTSVVLSKGRYRITFWAAADLGATARIHCSLDAKEAVTATVDENWKKITAVVAADDRDARVSLRLWTSTARVKVWFDDVELEALD